MAIFFFFNMSLIKVETGYLHRETTSLLPSSFTLTFLMLLPEREYGRWTNTGAYYWWSQWEGSVSKPLYKPVKKRKRHKSTSASTPRFLTPRRAFGEISPFSSALLFFLQPVKRLGFDMPSLISCLFFFLFSDDRRGTRAAVKLMWTKQGRKISRLPEIPHWAEKQSLGIRKGRRKR